jgi:hypothetical protein
LPLQLMAATEPAKRNESTTLKNMMTAGFNNNGWRTTSTRGDEPSYIKPPELATRRDLQCCSGFKRSFPKGTGPNHALGMALFLSATPLTRMLAQNVIAEDLPLLRAVVETFWVRPEVIWPWLSLASSLEVCRRFALTSQGCKPSEEISNRSHRPHDFHLPLQGLNAIWGPGPLGV